MTEVKDFFDLKLAHHFVSDFRQLLAFRKRYSVFKERVAIVIMFAVRTVHVSGEDLSYRTQRCASSPFQKISKEIFEGHLLMTTHF